MEAADTLCESLFRWLENREECAEELEKLEQEPEDVPQRSNITQVFRASISAAFTSVCPTSTLVKAGVSSSVFNKAIELMKEDEKVGTSIQEQLRELKDRCGETLKDRCGETLKDRCGETLKDRCGETLKARCGETLKDRCGETLKDRCGETLKDRCVCGETLKDRCGETLKDRCGETLKDRCGETQKDRCGETLKDSCGETLKDRCGETLKDRCGETLKDSCGEAPHADELDCEVVTRLMWALARRRDTPVPLDFLRGFNRATFFRHLTPGGLDPAEASDFICKALGLDRSPQITSSLKVSAKEMVKNIELIGIKADKAGSEGATGLGISLVELIVKSKELAKDNRVTEDRKILRDSSSEILDGQQELKEQLDAMHEIIQKLFRLKNLIKDLGGYSLSMTEKGWNIINYIIGTCTEDTVVSWLQGLSNQTEFVNVLRFCLERLSVKLPDLNLLDQRELDIVIVGHGRIVDEFMPAGALVPTPNITDTILYSPWNCPINSNTAFAIAEGFIQVTDRKFLHMAYCEPNPLPDHWNSMRRSPCDIPMIYLFPVTPEEDAWALFQQFWVNRGMELEDRVILPYLLPQDEVEAIEEIPLFIFILATSYILSCHGKTATVHLAACLGSDGSPLMEEEWVKQYGYTSDGSCMTVSMDDKNMHNMLFLALSSLFDRNRR